MDDRELQIRTGQAINLAFQYAALSGAVTSIEDAISLAKEAVPDLVDAINVIQASMAFKHAAATPAGVTPIAAAPSYQAPQAADQPPIEAYENAVPDQPAPQAQPQVPQVQGATAPGNSKTDQKWMDYFNNPSRYWDNRLNKRNPNSPDFKHKDTGDGLWLSGKYPAPAWVIQRLQGESF